MSTEASAASKASRPWTDSEGSVHFGNREFCDGCSNIPEYAVNCDQRSKSKGLHFKLDHALVGEAAKEGDEDEDEDDTMMKPKHSELKRWSFDSTQYKNQTDKEGTAVEHTAGTTAGTTAESASRQATASANVGESAPEKKSRFSFFRGKRDKGSPK